MYIPDDAWLVTTEATLEPSSDDHTETPRIHARVVALPSGDCFRRLLGELPESDPPFKTSHGKPGKVLERALSDMFIRAGHDHRVAGELAYASYGAMEDDLVVPVFGSPPTSWQALGHVLATGGPASAAVQQSVAGHPSMTFLCAMGGLTLLLNATVLPSQALGRGLAYRIDRLLGTPSEAEPVPQAAEAATEVSAPAEED